MFRLASFFLTMALGSALLGFGGILTDYAVLSRLVFAASLSMCILLIVGGGIRHTRHVKAIPVRAPNPRELVGAPVSSAQRDIRESEQLQNIP